MSKLKLFLTFVFLSNSIFSQNIGEWKIYSDMKDVKDIHLLTNAVWAVSNGGAYKYSFADTSSFILNKANGMNSQTLTSITVDSYGKIWMGSQEGYVIVYDPSKKTTSNILEIFKSDKTRKQINNLFASGDTILVSTDFGIVLMNANNLSFFDTFLKLGNFSSESKIISTYKKNLIYVVTESGVAVQKQGVQNLAAPESWDSYPFGVNLPVSSASKIISYAGNILLATDKGVYRLQNQNWSLFILQGSKVIDLNVQGNSLFAATENKVFEFNGSNTVQLYENNSHKFTSLSVSSDKTLFISSNNGIIETKGTVTKYHYPNGPPKNQFISIAVNGSGKLYVATGKDLRGVGFFEFDGTTWKLYNKEKYPQLPSNDYLRVSTDESDIAYFANWGRGVLFFNNGQFEIYTADNSQMVGIPIDPTFLAISDVRSDSKKNIWIANHQPGNGKYLSVYTNDKKWYHYDFENPSLSSFDYLDRLHIDQFGTKWVSVLYGNRGIYYFNEKGTFENTSDDIRGFITLQDGLIGDQVYAIESDKRGYIWIGTNQGISVITDPSKPKSTITNIIALALRNQTVTSIAIDPIDQKWIGTKQGVFVLSSDGYQLVNYYNSKNSPIPNDDIKSIAIDAKKGLVYIGTDYGLATLQTSSIKPVDSFTQLSVYPNPFVINSGHTQITIDGLVKNSSIKILDITGNLIVNLASPGGRVAFWNGKDSNGNYVSTGIYLIVAHDAEANNVTTSKVAVIRK